METFVELILLAEYGFGNSKWSKKSIISATTAGFLPCPFFYECKLVIF